MAATRFKLCTYAHGGEEGAGLLLDGDEQIYDIARLQRLSGGTAIAATIRAMLDVWDTSFAALSELANRIAGGWEEADSAKVSRDGISILAPVQPPGLIFQAAANYKSHVWQIECGMRRKQGMSEEEAASPAEREAYDRKIEERIANDPPYIFQGVSHAICGAYDDIMLPARFGQNPDWEVELGVIFGRTARYVERERARETIAGYVICNDLSHRPDPNKPRTMLGNDWLSMKNSPGFFPTGPYLVPAAFVPDPMNLQIAFRLNGQTYQDESTAGMIYDIDHLISHLSFVTIVKPGDMLLTGSPSGNGLHSGRFLQPGDVIEAEITGLGVQRSLVIAEMS